MPKFSYKGVDSSGKSVSGSVDANDRKQAMNKLRAMKIRPVQMKQGRGGSSGKRSAPETVERNETETRRVSFLDRFQKGGKLALPFFQKLLQLHSSGMPLGDAVSLMSQRVSSAGLKELSSSLYKDLSEGRTLASAMRQMPEVFDDTMTYLIEAGEATGNVVPILENIIDSLNQREDLQKKIRSAMAYPILICFVALGVVGLFLFFLLPRIQGMIDSLGGELNFFARVMIGLSGFALKEGPFVVVGLILLSVGYMQWRKTEKGRITSDRLLLKVPLLKHLYYNSDICRVSNVTSILLSNGVNTTESLRLAENTLQNQTLLGRFQASRGLINDGAAFSAAFKKHHFLPEMDLDILSIGENTGSVVRSFQEIYKTHAEELESRLRFVTNLIAGCALGFAFGLVFVLTLGIVMSILQLSQNLMGT